MPELTVGCEAYYDSFAGLIPCKVTLIKIPREEKNPGRPSTQHRIDFILTASRRPYEKGEKLTASALHVIPRDAVYVRSGQYRIGPYTVAK
jgi:hypothetical protein